MGISNFYKNKFTTLLIVLILASMALLIAGLATRWYKVHVYTPGVLLSTQEFSFYATKIIREILDDNTFPESTWTTYDLENTHKFFNAGMAIGVIAFVVGIISLILVVLKQLEVFEKPILWHITRGFIPHFPPITSYGALKA